MLHNEGLTTRNWNRLHIFSAVAADDGLHAAMDSVTVTAPSHCAGALFGARFW